MYKPLPSYLTIKTSKVNGLGLFALENIALGTNMGMSHLKIGDNIFRTPLGGFINHANDANCVKAELRMTNEDVQGNSYSYKKWNLITIKDIQTILKSTLDEKTQKNLTILLYAEKTPITSKSSFDDLNSWKEKQTYK